MQALDDIAGGVGALLVQLDRIARSQTAVTELLDGAPIDLEHREADLIHPWALVAGACYRVSAAVETDRDEPEQFLENRRALAPPFSPELVTVRLARRVSWWNSLQRVGNGLKPRSTLSWWRVT